MSRTKTWLWIFVGGIAYVGIKVGFGFTDLRTAISVFFDACYWTGAALLINWAMNRSHAHS